jgi:hypothetical protein
MARQNAQLFELLNMKSHLRDRCNKEIVGSLFILDPTKARRGRIPPEVDLGLRYQH